MVFNFTVHQYHTFKSCQTRWPLIGLGNLILIGQLRIWWKQTKAFFHTLTAVKMLCHSKQKMQTKVANICRVCTECITIVWFDSKFFLFVVNYMFRSLWICYHDVYFTYGNHSINQDSPYGQWESRCLGYLVRKLNSDVMRN